jgi:hypothetical protein
LASLFLKIFRADISKKLKFFFRGFGTKHGTPLCEGGLNSLGHEQNGLDEIPRIAYKAFDYVTRRLDALPTTLKGG